MKDFIKRYQNHKLFTNINIVLASLVLAIGINFLLIDGSDIGKSLKASVINSQVGTEKADVYLKNIKGELFLISNKNISNISTLSLSINYYPENVIIDKITSDFGEVLNLGGTPGIKSIILNTQSEKNIIAGDQILKITAYKKNQTNENINIVNANFFDNQKEQYLLSTSGITF